MMSTEGEGYRPYYEFSVDFQVKQKHSSVFCHCLLHNRNDIWRVNTCTTYDQRFLPRTSAQQPTQSIKSTEWNQTWMGIALKSKQIKTLDWLIELWFYVPLDRMEKACSGFGDSYICQLLTYLDTYHLLTAPGPTWGRQNATFHDSTYLKGKSEPDGS